MKMHADTHKFSISIRQVCKVLIVITASLVLLHLLLQFLFHVVGAPILDTLLGRFDVDNEISVPTWWSQVLLLIPAVLGLVMYKIRSNGKKPGTRWWWAVSGLFLSLSVDEGAMLHEAFITKFRQWSTDGTATGLANHLWLIPVGIVCLLLLAPFIHFLKTLNKRCAVIISIGIGTLVFGAVLYETFGLMVFSGLGGFWYQGFNVAVEESLEMLGACIVIFGLLEQLKLDTSGLSISLKD